MSFWPFRCFPWKEVTELFLDNFCLLTISKFYCVFHEIPRKSECKRLNSFQGNNNSTEVFAIPDTDRRFFWRKVIFLDLFEFRFTLGILSSKKLKHGERRLDSTKSCHMSNTKFPMEKIILHF